MAEILDLFRSELPARVRALEEAWAQNRPDELINLAHQLKGACAGYGYAALSAAAGELEGILRRPRGLAENAPASMPAAAAAPLNELLTLCRRALAA